ncbi:hypothetical protein ISF_09781 [Cordyceps fumosorosea ARSEF 2679]|uniref:Uncharacterized protein n=1 Tax=Cordyceps fumosorosea (strain ARSEF 2679) TaxID=1081104 RepID=A0A167CIW8_CORFA|nr:hypothetical protein ISF_09781 [Cordyceps fumosorosea ARSEF 2679]OAA41249.1 hypothetical protein ISF_09781 [Cordyceps fumosorosea ARSEF 2679]
MSVEMPIDEEDYRPPLPERPLLVNTPSLGVLEIESLPSTQLKRAPGMVANCVLYAALAVAVWVIICITAHRPINAHSFTYDQTWAADHTDKFQKERNLGSYGLIECESYIKAARVMQALVGILTIPLTSAVCSRASVDWNKQTVLCHFVAKLLGCSLESDVQSTLWLDTSYCDKRTGANVPYLNCEASFQNTLKELVYLKDTFWAPLPFKFNTGAMTQFAPRLNSSVRYQDWAGEPLPASCRRNTSFWAKTSAQDLGYNATVCVPDVYARSPWLLQRRSQDFIKELYLDVSFGGPILEELSSGQYTAR